MSIGPGGKGTKAIRSSFPFAVGLTAETTKQTETPSLIPEKSNVLSMDKKGI